MSGVHKSRADALGEVDRFAIRALRLNNSRLLSVSATVNNGAVGLCIPRRAAADASSNAPAPLQVSSIEHDQLGEFRRCHGRNDFAAKPAFGQQRQPPAMIKVGVRQQHKIDAGGIETKVAGIFLCEIAAALIEPTIDQEVPAGTFDEVA